MREKFCESDQASKFISILAELVAGSRKLLALLDGCSGIVLEHKINLAYTDGS